MYPKICLNFFLKVPKLPQKGLHNILDVGCSAWAPP